MDFPKVRGGGCGGDLSFIGRLVGWAQKRADANLCKRSLV